MPKRKAKHLGDEEEPRRASRRLSKIKGAAAADNTDPPKPRPKSKKSSQAKVEETLVATEVGDQTNPDDDAKKPSEPTKPKPAKAKSAATATTATTKKPVTDVETAPVGGRQYWLMKAEPESRLENGHDISFSIDDLAAKTSPEPWDGIRNYGARNNLRAMKTGDLAFFYHSSCKIPGIAGIMEVVQEHSPDLTAHDPSRPYYDASSKPEDPKWSVVHVEFRRKLKELVTLKELKEWQKEEGHPLKEMQMLRMGRMSVSRVTGDEWKFLTGIMRERGEDVDL